MQSFVTGTRNRKMNKSFKEFKLQEVEREGNVKIISLVLRHFDTHTNLDI